MIQNLCSSIGFQDSFEDDKSKILMILCASPDTKELHKTISTLEYGAKAKCIIRAAHTSTPREKFGSEESSTTLNSRIVAMNQFIYKLQKENKQREKERNEAQNLLRLKEEELAQLRAKIKLIQVKGAEAKEQEIDTRVLEKTQVLRSELMKMEEIMSRQQQELAALKQRLQEVEHGKDAHQPVQQDIIGGRLLARLTEMPAGLDQSMSVVESMDLDMGDQPQDVKITEEDTCQHGQVWNHTIKQSCADDVDQEDGIRLSGYPEKVILRTVFEEWGEDDGEKENDLEEEVCKEVVDESFKVDITQLAEPDDPDTRQHRIQNIFRLCGNHRELAQKPKVQSPAKDAFADENISPAKQVFKQAFGDENKELSPWGVIENPMCDVKVTGSPVPSQLSKQVFGDEKKETTKQAFGDENKELSPWGVKEKPMCDVKVTDCPVASQLSPIVCQAVDVPLTEQLKSCNKFEENDENKENNFAVQKEQEGLLEVYIKWESGNLIKGLKLLQNACLSDLRKLIEAHIKKGGSKHQHQFIFLLLGVCPALSISCFHPSAPCYLFLIAIAMSFICHQILSWKKETF
jgi:kinesin family member 11